MEYKRIAIPKGLVVLSCLDFPKRDTVATHRFIVTATVELLQTFAIIEGDLRENDPAGYMQPDEFIEKGMQSIGNDLMADPLRFSSKILAPRLSLLAWVAVKRTGDADRLDHLNAGGSMWAGLCYLEDETVKSGYELEFRVEPDECIVPKHLAPKYIRCLNAAKKAIRLH